MRVQPKRRRPDARPPMPADFMDRKPSGKPYGSPDPRPGRMPNLGIARLSPLECIARLEDAVGALVAELDPVRADELQRQHAALAAVVHDVGVRNRLRDAAIDPMLAVADPKILEDRP